MSMVIILQYKYAQVPIKSLKSDMFNGGRHIYSGLKAVCMQELVVVVLVNLRA